MTRIFYYIYTKLFILEREFQLVFKNADDPSTALLYFGESLYNHIIHFAPKSTSKFYK